MSLWHADMTAATFDAGVRITVSSPHRVVRVVAADQLSIAGPDGDRIMAMVLNRTSEQLTLVLPNGDIARLSMTADSALEGWAGAAEFSHQLWTVN